MKDLGTQKYFLGIQVTRSKQGIYLPQRKYALDILHDIQNLSGRPHDFPLEKNLKLKFDAGSLLSDPLWYRHLVDHLFYLTIT